MEKNKTVPVSAPERSFFLAREDRSDVLQPGGAILGKRTSRQNVGVMRL